jgi:hypothetical protein
MDARYERGAMILTSNRGFAASRAAFAALVPSGSDRQLCCRWGEVFGGTVVATALLDRLLHHAVVVNIEGASYRLRRHADLIQDSARVRPVAPPAQAPRRRGRPPKQKPVELASGA